MHDAATTPDDDADELFSDQLADAFLDAALAAPGPIRLACLQAMGLLPPPGSPISQELIAAALGITRKRVRLIEARGLATLRRHLNPNNPAPSHEPH